MQDVAKSPLSLWRGDLGVRLMLMPEKSFPDELKSVIGIGKWEFKLYFSHYFYNYKAKVAALKSNKKTGSDLYPTGFLKH